MNYLENYYLWRTNEFFDSNTKNEVCKLDEKLNLDEIKDRFGKELTYNTDGMIGKMEVGTNRVNIYTIGKMTASFVIYLFETYGRDSCVNNGVVVGFGARKNSLFYAKIIAKVFSGFGIRVYLQNAPVPSSFVSFAINYLGTVAGIMVTAESDDFDYNGLKFYSMSANEIDDTEIEKLKFCFNQITFYNQINFLGDESYIISNDYSGDYIKNILKQATNSNLAMNNNIKIAYSPLFGLGSEFVVKTLISSCFKSIGIVEEHKDFERVFGNKSISLLDEQNKSKVIKFASELNLDLAIMTSFDCEKIMIAIKHKNEYLWLTSNEMTILLFDYLVQKSNKSKLSQKILFKNLISSGLIDKMAASYGIECVDCRQNHKYISENIAKKVVSDVDNYYDIRELLFASDNEFGFWTNKNSKERDSVLSSLIFAEMTSYYKYFGKDLYDRLQEIYDEYGYFYEEDEEFDLSNDSADVVDKMYSLRNSNSPFIDTIVVVDYSQKIKSSSNLASDLNIIKYKLKNNSSVTIAGNEKKQIIKVHYSIYGDNEKFSKQLQQRYHLVIRTILDV